MPHKKTERRSGDMKVIYDQYDQKVPIKLWLDDIEDGALEQAKNLSRLGFIFKHVAIMPDSHQGYGMPIGGVIALDGVVIPNAVGVDIGCGMCAIKTPWTINDIDIETLKNIMGKIRANIPVGFAHHKEKQLVSLMPSLPRIDNTLQLKVTEEEYDNALEQIGTLGGGNHFIEIQKDESGEIWIMLHSGSRNFGLKVAKYYNDKAVALNKKWHSDVPAAWELGFLPIKDEVGRAYLVEMEYCVEFALANRELMMNRIIDIFEDVLQLKGGRVVDRKSIINIAHNYAAMEHHFGRDVLVHRKGATLARTNTIGIIPGSQGTKSYIVQGKGNPDSFMSCSHGAGRRLGRKQAQRELILAHEKKILEEQGILHSIRGINDLDEATGAYKDISVVMANQDDLVDILVELTPLAVIKG